MIKEKVEIQIEDYLRRNCKTEGTAVLARNLSSKVNIGERDLRNYIHNMRRKGIPVCSSCRGYWFATSTEDINKTLAVLRGWKKGLDEAIKALNKIKKRRK